MLHCKPGSHLSAIDKRRYSETLDDNTAQSIPVIMNVACLTELAFAWGATTKSIRNIAKSAAKNPTSKIMRKLRSDKGTSPHQIGNKREPSYLLQCI